MTTALNNSILAVGSGGTVIWPAGQYLTSAPILAENLTGLTIQCASGAGTTGTIILGTHTGKAILSLVGSNLCTVGPLVLSGSAVTTPKTGLLLGRSSGASAGSHNFYGLGIAGTFQLTGLYNVASESNCFFGINVQVTAATYSAVYLSGADGLAVGGLTGSSMEDNKFYGGTIAHYGTAGGTCALYLVGSVAFGHMHFYSTFFVKAGGDSFILFTLGSVDGLGTQFPVGFHNCFGEQGSSAPSYGLHIFNLTATNPLALTGLTATNLRFQTPTTNHIYCSSSSGAVGVELIGAYITTPSWLTGTPVGSIFGKVDDCTLVLQTEPAVTIAEATGSNISVLSGAPTITTNTGGNVIRAGGTTYTPPVLSQLIVTNAAPTAGASQIAYGGTAATSATTGSNGAPPAQVAGYIICNIGGTAVKVPYYNT
jgi:hypothetical protein